MRLGKTVLAAMPLLLVVFVAGAQEDEPTTTAPSASDIAAGYRLAPRAFRLAAERVTPSLVSIETFGGVAASGATRPGRTGGLRRPGDGPTTGLIISPDGYIVTSTFNFLEQPPVILVTLRDGRKQVAKLLGRDDGRKLCLLKIDEVSELPVPEFAPRESLKVGQWAISVGIGYGDTNPAISAGMISATSRISGRAVQTDANLSPANYGGPLVDIEGRVIGICTPLSGDGGNVASGVEWYDSGIGFAVPLHGADRLLAALKAGENVKPGFLGVQMASPQADINASGAPAENEPGVLIEKVLDDSPAAKAGLAPQDRILSIDGETAIDAAALRILLGKRIAGETVRVEFVRGGETKTAEATLAAAPEPQPMPMQTPPRRAP
jgi:serine protease Do